MFPINLDLHFWFCENAHDAPCKIICRALFDDQFPCRVLVILVTFLLLSIAQFLFYACCMVCPCLISSCYENPPSGWLVNGDDAGWQEKTVGQQEPLVLQRQKELMRQDTANFDFDVIHYLTDKTLAHCECCSICLHDYRGSEDIVQSRQCRHVFHEDCLARWLSRGHSICPYCRTPVHISEVGK